jgi:hypothetical protein
MIISEDFDPGGSKGKGEQWRVTRVERGEKKFFRVQKIASGEAGGVIRAGKVG